MSDSGENTIDAAAAEPLALSQLLSRVVDDHDGDRLKLSELAARLSDRSWGGLLLIFAAINILPLPPGATTITGIPLVLLSAQMAAGRSTPWFPQRFDQRGVTKGEITKLIAKLLPWERRIERVLKPRLTALTNHRGARAIGIVCLLLSVILWLPIPLGNHAPAITMTLYFLIFGGLIGSRVGTMDGIRYMDFIVPGLSLSNSLTYVDSKIISNPGFQSATGTTSQGMWVPYVPQWRDTVQAVYRPNENLSFAASARYQGKMYSTLDNSDYVQGVQGSFDPFFVLDAHVRCQVGKAVSAEFGVDNLTDSKYFLFHPFPGRTFIAGLKIKL